MGDSRFGRLRQRLSSLGNDNFFTLTDAMVSDRPLVIEELDDVSGGFGEGDVGDHGVDLLRCSLSQQAERFFHYKPWGKGDAF